MLAIVCLNPLNEVSTSVPLGAEAIVPYLVLWLDLKGSASMKDKRIAVARPSRAGAATHWDQRWGLLRSYPLHLVELCHMRYGAFHMPPLKWSS